MVSLSKAEYLKKYLSDGTEAEKKKKKKKKIKSSQTKVKRLKIVDDDVDFKSLLPDNLGNTLEEDVGDDEPTIAEFIDERPNYIKQLEQYRQDRRWRILGDDEKESDSLTKKHDSDSDQSPPRRKRHDSDFDQSPPRRKRHDSDSDQSPSRRKRHDSDSDQSPSRRKRHVSDSDQSPPRRKRHDSGSDQSPPRRKRHDSASDQSPHRRKPHDSDVSFSKMKKRSRWETEEGKYSKEEKEAIALEAIKDAKGRAAKTLGGATAGLSSAEQMKLEARLMKQREDEMFKKLDDEALGKNAKTVHRDKKSGRRRSAEKEEEISPEEAAKAAERAEKYKAWNKGLKQAQLQQQALEEVMQEISKPLTRHRDDADLEAHLKAQEREGDPMLAFIKKKKATKDTKKKQLPRYSGPEPPPNRFNIWPGYRWDGVDRSNGFEKKFFSKLSEKKAIKEIAYKWSVEDM